MATFAPPTVARFGATDPRLPLVVLLHGRGSSADEFISLAPHLATGAEYIALDAPIGEGGGFAWFANRGIGRPVATSLTETMAWFREWLDEYAPAPRPVILVGFSGGGAFAGGLMLDEPQRFAGAAVLYATVPWDAGVPTTADRLAGFPVFLAHGKADRVIPRDLLDRTWAYLTGDSGSDVTTHLGNEGHGLSQEAVDALNTWLTARFTTPAPPAEH